MQAKLKNPYFALNPISDPQMFYGPHSVLHSIFSVIASNQSASLVGPRHSGKTTLLLCLMLPEMQTRLGYDPSQYFFVYLDVRNCLRKTCADFFDFLSDEILAASRGRLNLELPVTSGEDRFIDLLREVKEQGFHTVLLLDPFDDITLNPAFDPQFFLFLRAQATAGLVSYVTASVAPLQDICHPAIQGSPFFNIFGVYAIQPLTLQEAHDLVLLPSQLAGCPFMEEERAWVLKRAGRQPFFIQRLCFYLFEEKSQHGISELGRKRVAKQAYKDLLPHFQYLWDALSVKEQEALKEESDHTTDLEREMPLLSESSFFRSFVRERYGLDFFRQTPEQIEDELTETLKHLDSLNLLAKSKLRYLKCVARRIEQQGITSPYEIGRVIRQVLTEALEQLKGEGERSDTNHSWMVYNILSYTYFNKRNSLNQQGIAQRLAMSLRQYHREKDEAIHALCNQLLEIEAACRSEDDD